MKISPETRTTDEVLQDRSQRHPLLEGKAMNVSEFKKGC